MEPKKSYLGNRKVLAIVLLIIDVPLIMFFWLGPFPYDYLALLAAAILTLLLKFLMPTKPNRIGTGSGSGLES